MDAEMLSDYRELAREIKLLLGPKYAFALLMRLDDGQFHYASNADRDDMRKTFVEWLERATVCHPMAMRQFVIAGARGASADEKPEETRVRLDLEARTAELGHVLEALLGYALILVVAEFGEGGNLAWYTNYPGARAVVEGFLKVAAAEAAEKA